MKKLFYLILLLLTTVVIYGQESDLVANKTYDLISLEKPTFRLYTFDNGTELIYSEAQNIYLYVNDNSYYLLQVYTTKNKKYYITKLQALQLVKLIDYIQTKYFNSQDTVELQQLYNKLK